MNTASYEQSPEAARGHQEPLVLTGTYVLGRRIGRGGMGEVFDATHTRLPGRYAVKLLLPELIGNREAFARFCREAEIMSELRHPNIVQIFDFNTAPDGRPYFVMEYLEGRDLEARLEEDRALPLPAVVRIVNAVASALAAAHAHGVVHRDLKPSNIFLATVDGQTDELIKVLDFGISKMRAASTRLSQSSEMLGTPSYMSPEQARGRVDEVDGRTDQFALGAIAYRMLTGAEAFQGDDSAAVLYQVVHETPPALATVFPPTWDPVPLQSVLDRALAKDVEQRWGGMMELARAFEEAAERTIEHGAAGSGSVAIPATAAANDNDAAVDEAPPVRKGPPLRLVTPPARNGRPAAIALEDEIEPAAAHDREGDWEMRRSELRVSVPAIDTGTPEGEYDVDRVPVTHHRAAALGVVALVLAGTLVATGWYREVPSALRFTRDNLAAWTRHETALPQPTAAPAQPEPAPAPAPAATEAKPAPTPEAPAAVAAPAASAPTESAPAKPAPLETKPAPDDRATPPDDAASKPARPEEPHRHHRVRRPDDTPVGERPGVLQLVPDTPAHMPAPSNTSPSTKTTDPFKIAPPKPQESTRDLAPGEPGTGDETLPPSNP